MKYEIVQLFQFKTHPTSEWLGQSERERTFWHNFLVNRTPFF